MRVVGDISRLNARRFPHKFALHCAGRALTFQAADTFANRLANSLLAQGVRPGDRVAILALNVLEYIPLFFATAKCGTLCVPLNYRSSVAELAYMLDDAKAETLFVGPEFAETALALRQRVPGLSRLIAIGPAAGAEGMMALDDLIATGNEDDPGIEIDEATGVAIMYTSGTTGHPKGAVLSHRSVVDGACQTALVTGTRHTDTVLVTVPLFHGGGLMVVSMPHLYLGASLVISEKFDPVASLESISGAGITTLFGVPTQYAALLDVPRVERYDVSCLRTVWYGAAPMPPEILQRLLLLWPKVLFVQCYGQTETTLIACLGPEEHHAKQGTTGRELPGIEMRVVDDSGADVPPETVGEIIVRQDTGMIEYYGKAEQTRDTVRDGWIYTGDLARIDEERYITLVDRKRDVILSGGENIYPKEIEDCLCQHLDIAQVAVVGTPDAKWGEVPLAFVVLQPGSATDVGALEAWCMDRLARYKRPRRWAFVESLPLTATGKVRKNVLRQWVRDRRDGVA